MASPRAKPNLTDDQRQAVYNALLTSSDNGKLKRGSIKAVAEQFEVSRDTVERIWKRRKSSLAAGSVSADVRGRKRGNSGRKGYEKEELQEAVAAVTPHKRATLRQLEAGTGIGKSILHRAKKKGTIVRRTSTVKPTLTDANKLARMQFALSFVRDQLVGDELYFDDMMDHIHIYEKWFNMSKVKRNMYMTPEEDMPHRNVKSKHFIPKVMFMCAVARPRYDRHRKRQFDGKIGIWPLVEEVAAKRNSRNRPKGTVEKKPVNVTKDVYRSFLIDEVFPAIREQWPSPKSRTIWIQQDNARPHVAVDDPEIVEAGKQNGWDIRLKCQPPNSPDLNALDLGFFNSIQSLQDQTVANSVEELLTAVEAAYVEMPRTKVTDTFQTLQKVFECVLKAEGGNNYDLTPEENKHDEHRETR
eukprot:IDg1066t1